jgi:hypothetical protein
LLLLVATVQITVAQTTATGWVKDEKGNPLRFAFVADPQYKNGAYSDSSGYFSIAVHPDSKLEFQLPGYKDTTMNVDKSGADIVAVLKSTGSSGSGNSPGGLSAQVSVQTSDGVATTDQGGVMAPTHQKGNLRGSQYLFMAFVHGYLINASGDLVQSPDYLFDYDKIGGGLLLTKDKKNISELGWDQTQSFVLFNNANERFEFEKYPAIDKSHYVQVLASGKKYKIYKLIKTRFVKSDFVNNGVTQHGNDYDEYVDDADYYVLDVAGNQPQKLSLRKKSIKEDFAKEADKVNKYLSDHSGDINDAYLSKLGAYMNNN